MARQEPRTPNSSKRFVGFKSETSSIGKKVFWRPQFFRVFSFLSAIAILALDPQRSQIELHG